MGWTRGSGAGTETGTGQTLGQTLGRGGYRDRADKEQGLGWGWTGGGGLRDWDWDVLSDRKDTRWRWGRTRGWGGHREQTWGRRGGHRDVANTGMDSIETDIGGGSQDRGRTHGLGRTPEREGGADTGRGHGDRADTGTATPTLGLGRARDGQGNGAGDGYWDNDGMGTHWDGD